MSIMSVLSLHTGSAVQTTSQKSSNILNEVDVFYLLLGCLTANLGPLSMGGGAASLTQC